MESSFYSEEELGNLGFKSVGNNCLISRYARFYSIQNIEIGNRVRIDDFCILSGHIKLGSFIHISAFCGLYGSKGIRINDYSGLSPHSLLFSATDDFSGDYLINPMVPKEYTNVTGGEIVIEKYVQLGANTIVLPKVCIGEGTVTGAHSLVRTSVEPWKICGGIPSKVLKERSREFLKFIPQIPN